MHQVVSGSWRLALVACDALLERSSVRWLQGQQSSVPTSDWYQTGDQDSDLHLSYMEEDPDLQRMEQCKCFTLLDVCHSEFLIIFTINFYYLTVPEKRAHFV